MACRCDNGLEHGWILCTGRSRAVTSVSWGSDISPLGRFSKVGCTSKSSRRNIKLQVLLDLTDNNYRKHNGVQPNCPFVSPEHYYDTLHFDVLSDQFPYIYLIGNPNEQSLSPRRNQYNHNTPPTTTPIPNVGLWLRKNIILYITWLAAIADWRLRVSVLSTAGLVAERPSPAWTCTPIPRSCDEVPELSGVA